MTVRTDRLTGPAIFVFTAWLAIVAAAIGYVLHFGSSYLFGDEWDLAGGLSYSEPYLSWLWAQHNEHRLPLPKLVYTALLNVSGFDARAGSLATVAVLAGLSFAMILAARRLRGRTDYADAFFPLAFLNWGHFENYLMGFQIGFALSAGLACLWLLSALGRQAWLGLPVLLLPLCGAHGLIYVAPLGLTTLWLTRGAAPSRRLASAGAVVTAFALSVSYFIGFSTPSTHPASAGAIGSLLVGGEVLALGWGWVGQMTWPASGLLAVAFVAASAALLVATVVREAGRRDEAVALTAVGAGTVALALGIGWGRCGFGPLAGFAVRYGVLMLPLMAAGFLAWVCFGGRVTASLVPMCLMTVAVLFLTQHFRTGLAEGRSYAAMMAAFDTDLRRGLSPEELARRNSTLHPDPARLAGAISRLRTSGIPPYGRIPAEALAAKSLPPG